MSKIKKCAECQEEIKWDEDVIIGEDGEVYHNECIVVYPTGFSVHSLDGDFLTLAEDPERMAICVLDSDEYIDEEDEKMNDICDLCGQPIEQWDDYSFRDIPNLKGLRFCHDTCAEDYIDELKGDE